MTKPAEPSGPHSPNIVEMDAMDVAEWEQDRVTPHASDAKLAALVRESTGIHEVPKPPPTPPRKSTIMPRAQTASGAQAALAKPVSVPSGLPRVVKVPSLPSVKPAPMQAVAAPVAAPVPALAPVAAPPDAASGEATVPVRISAPMPAAALKPERARTSAPVAVPIAPPARPSAPMITVPPLVAAPPMIVTTPPPVIQAAPQPLPIEVTPLPLPPPPPLEPVYMPAPQQLQPQQQPMVAETIYPRAPVSMWMPEPEAPLVRPATHAGRADSIAPVPTRSRRGLLIGGSAVAAVALVVIIAIAASSGGGKSSPVVATAEPPAPADSQAPAAAPPPAPAPPPVAAPLAPVDPAPAPAEAPATPSPPAPTAPAPRRPAAGNKLVLDYDHPAPDAPKPAVAPADSALTKARAAYAEGNQHLFAGDTESAITAYRRALALYPGYVAGYRGLGLAYAQLGDKPHAIDALRAYVNAVPLAKDVALIKKRLARLQSP